METIVPKTRTIVTKGIFQNLKRGRIGGDLFIEAIDMSLVEAVGAIEGLERPGVGVWQDQVAIIV
ncbi:hypothetical protein ACG74X_09960 [Marivita sp. S0852]|uniref:hypothetical protein n=1 Tax=Marivita sp. S0852 TaxID=3373893 RepID=UPI003982B20F